MVCEECQREPATVFLTSIVFGREKSRQLCVACAAPLIEEVEQMQGGLGATDAIPRLPDWFFEELASSDSRYPPAAWRFVLESVRAAISGLPLGGHLSAGEVAESFRLLAQQKFGTSALVTLRDWGIHSTDDLGTIVFLLAGYGILGLRPEDRVEDFHGLYDFETAFPRE